MPLRRRFSRARFRDRVWKPREESSVATVERTLRLRAPFGEGAAESAGSPVRREGDDFVADLDKGETLTLWAPDCPLPGEPGEAIEQAAQWVRDSDTSRIGLPPGIGVSSSERQARQAITEQSAD